MSSNARQEQFLLHKKRRKHEWVLLRRQPLRGLASLWPNRSSWNRRPHGACALHRRSRQTPVRHRRLAWQNPRRLRQRARVPKSKVVLMGDPENDPHKSPDLPFPILPTRPEDFPPQPEPKPEPELPATRPPGESWLLSGEGVRALTAQQSRWRSGAQGCSPRQDLKLPKRSKTCLNTESR